MLYHVLNITGICLIYRMYARVFVNVALLTSRGIQFSQLTQYRSRRINYLLRTPGSCQNVMCNCRINVSWMQTQLLMVLNFIYFFSATIKYNLVCYFVSDFNLYVSIL
jgi:hypothetical protein